MQEQHLFEYAVIRIVPRVEREEFFNVGVVLYCAKVCDVGFYQANDGRGSCDACKQTTDVQSVLRSLAVCGLLLQARRVRTPTQPETRRALNVMPAHSRRNPVPSIVFPAVWASSNPPPHKRRAFRAIPATSRTKSAKQFAFRAV